MHTDEVQHLLYKENTCTLRCIRVHMQLWVSFPLSTEICFTPTYVSKREHACLGFMWFATNLTPRINLMDRHHSTLTQIRHLYPLTMIFSASIIHLSTCMAASDSKVAVWIKITWNIFLTEFNFSLRHWYNTNIYLTADKLKTCAWGTATITLHKALKISICNNCIQISYRKHWKRKMVLLSVT